MSAEPKSLVEFRDRDVRLWHDDVRFAPPGWKWAQSNEAAQEVLTLDEVAEISIDHDLGDTGETGLDLVRWMVANDRVPPLVTIHSWNPAGAERMSFALVDGGYPTPTVAPFRFERAV